MGRDQPSDLEVALKAGDPAAVAALVAAGADLRYKRPEGYDALIDAVHGRDVARDARLLDLLTLLIANGVDLNGVSAYRESALRVLSRLGRFDGVKLLLDSGADHAQLGWTPLMETVALGTLAEVEAALRAGAPLEEVDWWSRTAWHLALLAGDVAKAQLLYDHGANADRVGRCRQPPAFYAIDGHHPATLRWLLDLGADPEQIDEFGATALMEAVEQNEVDCARMLIAAGVDVNRQANETALHRAHTRELACLLLDAGADPAELSNEGRRAILGFPPDPDESLVTASPEEYARACTRSFGNSNPVRCHEPFWESMVRAGLSGYGARKLFGDETSGRGRASFPTWSAERFGQSLTFLPDGRIVQIAGEHEDAYDPDFCIYNDVFVHGSDGSLTIFAYPKADFPPTDFHTATLVGDFIYVIGSLGYQGTRRYGETPVFRFDIRTARIERVATTGTAPGWIYRHRATLVAPHEIRICSGKIVTPVGDSEAHTPNLASFVLDLDRLQWRQEPPTS